MWVCYECAIQREMHQVPLLRSYGRCELCGNWKECFELIIHDKEVKGGSVKTVAQAIAETIVIAEEALDKPERKQEVNEMNRLRRIDPRGLEDTEDLVAFYTDAIALQGSYNELGINVPKWLSNKIAAVTREITERARAAKEAQLARLDAEIEVLKPDEVKLAEKVKAREQLRKELA